MESMDVLKKKLLTDLKEFPSSFHLDGCPVKVMQKVKKTLLSEREDDPLPFYENADENFLSFLEMQLGGLENTNSAEERNKKVRKSEPGNIVALANYANMLIESEDLGKAERTIGELRRMQHGQDYAEQVTNAKAELAYSYSKLGLKYHSQAIKIYDEILAAHPGKWQWKYRYGVVLQRCLNAEAYINDKDFDANTTFVKGVRALMDVINWLDADKTVAAKAWTKIGTLTWLYGGIPSVYKKADDLATNCLSDICRERDIPVLDTSYCMQEAIKLAPDDRTVLQEYGRFCRRGKNKDLKKARQYLDRSYRLHRTTFNCLHLGLLDVDEWNVEVRSRERRIRLATKKRSFDKHTSTEEQRVSADRNSSERDSHSVRQRPDISLDSGYCSFSHGEALPGATEELTSNMRDLSMKRSGNSDLQKPQPGSNVDKLMTSILKSPKYLKKERDPDNPLLNRALEKFEEASELCEHTSVPVFFSKGITHRRLYNPADAMKCFKAVLKIEACSYVNKVNCYEQRGLCYIELAQQEVDQRKKAEDVEDAIVMFSIAVQNAVVLSLPFHYNHPSSLTLQDLLKAKSEENPGEPESHKQLTRFYELLGQYSRALEYLDEALKLDPHDFNAYLDKARLLVSDGKCDEAVNLLTMLLTTVHRKHVLENKHVLVNAAVTAAERNLRKGKKDIAREYFLRAYQTVFETEEVQRDGVNEIFIIGQESDGTSPFQYFSEIVKEYFGLSYTCSNDIPPGEYEISHRFDALEHSRNILFVFSDTGVLTRKSELLVNAALEKPTGLHSISAVGNLPDSFRHVKFNQVPSYSYWRDVQNNSTEFVDLVVSLFKGIITTAC